MFGNLRLGLKIGLGFGVVLVLLSIVLGVGIFALDKAKTGLVSYDEMAQDSNLGGRLQANMLMVRMNVKDYLITGSDEDHQEYQNYLEKMRDDLGEARQHIKQPERASLISEIESSLVTYQEGFSKVVELTAKRQRAYDEELVSFGEDMSGAIADLIEVAFDEERSEAAYYANLVQERMLLGRLYVVRFLQSSSETDYVAAFKFLDTALKHQLNDLEPEVGDGELRELFDEFLMARTGYLKELEAIHSTSLERNNIVTDTLNVIGRQIAESVERLKFSVIQDQNALGGEVKDRTEQSINLTLFLSVLAVILGLAAAYFLTIGITKPIKKAMSVANRIADGDLTGDIGRANKDETGQLLSALQHTSENLKQMISTISGTSHELASASEKLAIVTEQSSQGILQQEAETDMVATAMNEMSVTVHDVADNASKAADAANHADEQAGHGAEVVNQTISSINSLSESVNLSAEKLSEVEQEVLNISSILDVIRGIADQTNLLALNAAIEAARAGEQGRGFAVVADEVRSLASRTQSSTVEIQGIIEQLQKGTGTTVKAMETGTQHAQTCVERAGETSAALTSITQAISVINDMNMQIASASEQQSSVAESINENVVNVKKIAEENSAASSQTKASSGEIAGLAEQLNQLVAQFRV